MCQIIIPAIIALFLNMTKIFFCGRKKREKRRREDDDELWFEESDSIKNKIIKDTEKKSRCFKENKRIVKLIVLLQ